VKELTLMPLRLNAERITDKGRGGSGAVSIIFAGVIAFLLYMSIVLYGQNVLRGVLEERLPALRRSSSRAFHRPPCLPAKSSALALWV
jgi:hypothetical protein